MMKYDENDHIDYAERERGTDWQTLSSELEPTKSGGTNHAEILDLTKSEAFSFHSFLQYIIDY